MYLTFWLRSMIEQKREEPPLISVSEPAPSPGALTPRTRVSSRPNSSEQLHYIDGVSMGTSPGYSILPHHSSLHCPTNTLMHPGVLVCLCGCSAWVILPAWDFDPQNTFCDDIYSVSVGIFSLTKNLVNYFCPKVTQWGVLKLGFN